MKKILNAHNWPLLALLLSAGLLIGALSFEHIGGMKPCQMCYWQRHAHKAVLAISALALIYRFISKNDKWDRLFLGLIGLAFVVSFGLAFWHTGVEYKWWEGPKTCSAIGSTADINVGDIMKALEGGKLPACSDAPWHLFKISMAGYNAALSGIAALFSFGFATKKKA